MIASNLIFGKYKIKQKLQILYKFPSIIVLTKVGRNSVSICPNIEYLPKYVQNIASLHTMCACNDVM